MRFCLCLAHTFGVVNLIGFSTLIWSLNDFMLRIGLHTANNLRCILFYYYFLPHVRVFGRVFRRYFFYHFWVDISQIRWVAFFARFLCKFIAISNSTRDVDFATNLQMTMIIIIICHHGCIVPISYSFGFFVLVWDSEMRAFSMYFHCKFRLLPFFCVCILMAASTRIINFNDFSWFPWMNVQFHVYAFVHDRQTKCEAKRSIWT